MRMLTDEEAHVLLLNHVDLIYEEHLVAERLVEKGYLIVQLSLEDDREYTDYIMTPLGDLALQCYLALRTQKSLQF